MKAGIVYYKRNGTSFEGQWGHELTNGVLARETVYDVALGPFVGEWKVEILNSDGTPLFSGELTSVRSGDCLKLTWVDGTSAYEGFGLALGDDLIIATFEPKEANEEAGGLSRAVGLPP